MMSKNNIWKTLADKETAVLAKLFQNKEALSIERKRLDARIADIDSYVFEYTAGLKQESDIEFGVKKINDKMNMITQLMTARSDLEVFRKGCDQALGALAHKISSHQAELLKFNKVRESQNKEYILSLNREEDKELDALALSNFTSAMK